MSKGKFVKNIEHRNSGLEVPVRLAGTTFFAEVLGQRYEADNFVILQTKVLDHIEHWMKLEWFPVIEVKCDDKDGWGSAKAYGVLLTYERYWLSRSPAGKALVVKWDVAPDHRKAQCRIKDLKLTEVALPFTSPFPADFNGSVNLINFTPERWEGLENIARGLKILGDRISDLVRSNEGNEQLGSTKLANHLLLSDKNA